MLASAGIDKLPKNVVFYVGQRWHRQITQKCGFLCWPALASTNYPKMCFLCWPALASTNYPKMWFLVLASAGIDKLPKNVVFYLASAGIDKLPKNVVFYVGQRWHRQITQKCGFFMLAIAGVDK